MDQLGKYRVTRELGRGSMGVVYEGFDPSIERRVAIKVVREDEIDRAQLPELLSRLRREAMAAGRLSHPGIVTVYDYGEDQTEQGRPVAFIAMELVDGRDLKELIDDGLRFDLAETTRLLSSVLAALRHAHERGVIHRDIKPANIMLLPDGTIKVADFGVARLDDSELTREGTVIGSPMYMSPEQLMGLPVDSRSDLYSCGVLLYQLLTGSKPFTGSYATVMQKVLNEEPAPPTKVNARLHPAWDALVQQAMAKNVDARFQTADAFATAIARAAAEPPVEVVQGDAADGDATVLRPHESTAPATLSATASGVSTAARTFGPTATWSRHPTPASTFTQAPASTLDSTATASGLLSTSAPKRQRRAVPPGLVVGPVLVGIVAIGGYFLLRPTTPDTAGTPSAASPRVVATAPPAQATTTPPAVTEAPPSAAGSAPAATATPPTPPVATPSEPASAVAPPGDWAARVARLSGASQPTDLPSAFARLLDIGDADRPALAEFNAMLRPAPRQHVALALAEKNGNVAFVLRVRPTAADAQAIAARTCETALGRPCQLVVVDGAFKAAPFAAMAATLGSRPAAEVRADLMRNVERVLTDSRNRTAIATAANEWTQGRTALAALAGRATLATALTALLDLQSGADVSTVTRFQDAIARLRWKSALALGENDGLIGLGYTSNEGNVSFASDAARESCARAPGSWCVTVMTNGQFDPAAFRQLAARLGTRPQAATREAFIAELRRVLAREN